MKGERGEKKSATGFCSLEEFELLMASSSYCKTYPVSIGSRLSGLAFLSSLSLG